ncbi:MAG TPA: hypothetical protein VF813_02550, partial [Anaerolineaceae bacterium]
DWKRPAWIGALFPLIALALYSAGTTIVGLDSVLYGYASRDSSLAYPWQGLGEFFSRIFSQQFQYADTIDLAVFILFFGALIYGIRKLRPALTLFSAALLVMVFSRSYSPNLLSGFNRFTLTTFPFFLSLTLLLSRSRLKVLVIAVFWLTQLSLVLVFIHWGWVG